MEDTTQVIVSTNIQACDPLWFGDGVLGVGAVGGRSRCSDGDDARYRRFRTRVRHAAGGPGPRSGAAHHGAAGEAGRPRAPVRWTPDERHDWLKEIFDYRASTVLPDPSGEGDPGLAPVAVSIAPHSTRHARRRLPDDRFVAAYCETLQGAPASAGRDRY